MFMKRKLNLNEKLRIFSGSIILLLGIVFNSWLGLIGLVPIAFVAIDFCPMCYFKETCGVKK